MESRPSTPENPHDAAAAALLELSQSRPRAAVNKAPEANSSVEESTPTPSPTVNFHVFKVSNSDDEDMGSQAGNVHRNTTVNDRTATLSASPQGPQVHWTANVRTQQPAGMHRLSRTPWSEIAHDMTALGRPSNVVFRLSSGTATEDDHTIPPIGLFSVHKLQRSDAELSSSEPDAARPRGQTTTSTATLPTRGRSVARGSLASRTKTTRPLTFVEASYEQPTQQPRQQPGSIDDSRLAMPVPVHQALHERIVPKGAQVPVQDRASSTGNKRGTTPPPTTKAAKRPRNGQKLTYAQTTAEVAKLAYCSCKAIDMPLPKEKPTPDSWPFGADVDHSTSMLLYWLDVVEMTYNDATRTYHDHFSGETPSEDTIRKRHHVALAKLAAARGLKPADELEEPSKVVSRRGQATGRRYDRIRGKAIYGPASSPNAEENVPRRKKVEPNADRGFLKACICVWKDTSDTTFEHIAQKMRNEYNWQVGASTVQKLYYSERQRVYGVHKVGGHGEEEIQADKEDENEMEVDTEAHGEDSMSSSAEAE